MNLAILFAFFRSVIDLLLNFEGFLKHLLFLEQMGQSHSSKTNTFRANEATKDIHLL